jgi:hypothetical protein
MVLLLTQFFALRYPGKDEVYFTKTVLFEYAMQS